MTPPMMPPLRLSPAAAASAFTGGALLVAAGADEVDDADDVVEVVEDELVVELVDELEVVEELLDELELLEEELLDEAVSCLVTRPEMCVMATVVLSPDAVAATVVP